jgi:hypothetical protein
VTRFVLIALLIATPARAWVPSEDPNAQAFGLIADFHGGANETALFIPAYLAAQTPAPTVVWHAGDVCLSNPGEWDSLQARYGAYGMEVATTLGNHEYDGDKTAAWPWLELYPNGESPIDSLAANAIPEIGTSGLPYYKRDYGDVRVLFVVNNIDTTTALNGAWWQRYPQCNPPGRYKEYYQQNGYPYGDSAGTNPEFAGWVTSDTTSGQLAWIKAEAASFTGKWLFVVAHRSPYAPMAWNPRRVPDRSGRDVGWAICSRAKVDFALTGDLHVAGWTLPMYRGHHVAVGTRFLTARCELPRLSGFGYGAESPSISEDDMVWPKEADLADANEPESTVFGYLVISGNYATMRVIQGHADGTFTVRAETSMMARRAPRELDE